MKNNCAAGGPTPAFSFRYGDRAVNGSASMRVDERLAVSVETACHPEFDATEWVLWFENTSGERSDVISDILDGDFLVALPPAPEKFKGDISIQGDRAVVTMNGCVPGIDYSTDDAKSATEFAAVPHYFHPMRGERGDVFEFANGAARSSDNQAPFFEVTQDGQGAMVAIGWTGGWRARFANGADGVRVEAGMARARFRLEPGEKLRTTRILVMNYSKGEDAGNKFRRLIRRHFSHVASHPGAREGLLAYELWGGLTSDEMIRRVRTLKAKGLAYEDLWIDAGWYGDSKKCDDAYTGDWSRWTGDWVPNRRIHPDGLADVAAAAKDAGMGMMLWFEPERVVSTARFAHEHPELLSGSLLWYGDDRAREHVRDTVSDFAERLGFSCYRQDFNYDPAGDLAKLDGPDREGVAEIRHVTGLYRLWDELLERFPHMLIDNCASGGRRIDIESLRRSVAFFRSDYQCGFNANADVLQAHNAGIARLLPCTGCTVKLSDAYSLRSAYSSSLGVAYWNAVFQDEEKVDWDAAKKCCDEYRRIRRFLPCDFHNHGSATMDPTAWAIWQYHDPESGEGVVMAFRRSRSPSDSAVVSLRGIQPGAMVETENLDTGAKETVPASAMRISLPERRSSAVLLYRAKPCGHRLLPVEVYEKGCGDIDRSARYSISGDVREAGVATADFRLFRRTVKVANPSDETRTVQIAVRAATCFIPSNWVIPGVIYGDNAFGSQVSPSGLERDGEPWVFGYDRESIPSCTLSETGDALFAMFASDRDAASLESSCSLKRLADGRFEHRIIYPVRESPVCYAFKYRYAERHDEWITLPPGAAFEAESFFMEGRPRWENCGYREAFRAAMAVLKHCHPVPALDAKTVYEVSHQWLRECCEYFTGRGESKGAMGTDIAFRLGYTDRARHPRPFPPWMTPEERKLTLADLERDPSLNRPVLRTSWMDEMGFAGQGFLSHRLAWSDAAKRGDTDFAKWCLDDLDDWVRLQVPSGLAPTRHHRKDDRLSITELGWGVGEIAKFWKTLKDAGVERPAYLEFAKRLADFFVERYDDADPFGRIWSLASGEKLEGGGDGGGFMAKGMLELHAVCGDGRYLDCARRAFDRYFEMDLGKFRCVAGADDCNCVDKESSFPFLYAALELHRQTGEKRYLDCAERVAAYFCSWMLTYDALYPKESEFGRFGYRTSGGTLVSAEHQCIDPYATVAIPDLFDLADLTGEDVWREAGRLIWLNAIQDVAGPDGDSPNGVLRTPGAQCEAHAQTRWSKYRSDPVAARGHFNNQCTAFIVAFRLYALDRVGDPMANRQRRCPRLA